MSSKSTSSGWGTTNYGVVCWFVLGLCEEACVRACDGERTRIGGTKAPSILNDRTVCFIFALCMRTAQVIALQ